MKIFSLKLSTTLVFSLFLISNFGNSRSPLLEPQEAGKLYRQVGNLMETTSFAVPELARAGAPLIENVRQASKALLVGQTLEHTAIMEKLLSNARIYLQIADAVPKPQSFAEDIQSQLTTLRTSIDILTRHFRASLERVENQIRDGDRNNLGRYSNDNSRLGPPGKKENRVVFLGDSITDGWRLNQYFPGKPYINRGISGQVTGEMLGRMGADVLALKPRVVVVLGGTNDLARGVKISTVQNNLSMIASLAQAHGIKPVIASILPISDYHKATDPNYERSRDRPLERIQQLNAWIRQVCANHGLIYLNYYGAVADSTGHLEVALSFDGLHPNSEGYKIMTQLAEQAISKAISGKPRRIKLLRFPKFL